MSETTASPGTDTSGLKHLSPLEARVLGCLMEKQRTTPDAYPLSLNALTVACNQKTSRNPVMNLDPGEVGHVANQLRDRGLIHVSLSGRVERYDHKMVSSYRLSREECALMCALMLRGPQTPGELRINVGRMAEFDSLAAVESLLAGLEQREPPLVVRLPRLPGKREERFAHLLCGPVKMEVPAEVPGTAANATGSGRIEALEGEIERLRAEIDALWELTGLKNRRPGG